MDRKAVALHLLTPVVFQHGGDEVVLHVGRGSYSTADDARVDRYLTRAGEMFAALGIKADLKLLKGSPAETIVQTAHSGGSDLVIVGAPLRGTRGEGDLVTKLAESLEASLLVVPMAPE